MTFFSLIFIKRISSFFFAVLVSQAARLSNATIYVSFNCSVAGPHWVLRERERESFHTPTTDSSHYGRNRVLWDFLQSAYVATTAASPPTKERYVCSILYSTYIYAASVPQWLQFKTLSNTHSTSNNCGETFITVTLNSSLFLFIQIPRTKWWKLI